MYVSVMWYVCLWVICLCVMCVCMWCLCLCVSVWCVFVYSECYVYVISVRCVSVYGEMLCVIHDVCDVWCMWCVYVWCGMSVCVTCVSVLRHWADPASVPSWPSIGATLGDASFFSDPTAQEPAGIDLRLSKPPLPGAPEQGAHASISTNYTAL